ncbi:hypothetical protein BDV33DRAFT_161754 [Aspergillus novoparasiticus]|uniref:Uncharacterized protein n=1 Tax=Aspergillus novoparasiticus TaxID=986946 RepID=A0A5N6EF19_9EURO|nr:hypothetical protein BDV33DRAFT_161754 [Aspergillus novoparasiticus]
MYRQVCYGKSVSQICHTKILKYGYIPNDATVVTTRTTGKGAEAAAVGRRATTREGYGVLLITQTRNGGEEEQRGVKLGNAERAGFSYLMIDQLAAEGSGELQHEWVSIGFLLAQNSPVYGMNFQEVEKTLGLGRATTKRPPKDLPRQEL